MEDSKTNVEEKVQKTELIYWDKYMDYLIEAIDESKFMKRAEIKPMSTPKAASESHVTSRSIHSRMAANVARRLAEGLGLNGNYIYTGMLMHDAGHPFSAHEGEEIFNLIGQYYNCGFYHHNAKGVEIIRSENIMEKAIAKIPNVKDIPGLQEGLEKEFPYFLDVIISHDGEASKMERKKAAEHYDTIAEAVSTKLTLANSKNDYKFVAQTPEGRLAKMADVIAYLATDILDGFRTGIINDFDDDYLELFGRMFTNNYSTTREENIACARNILQEIKKDKVRELKSDIRDEHNSNILQATIQILKDAEQSQNGDQTLEERIESELESRIAQMRKDADKLSEDDRQFLNAEISKLRDFVDRMSSIHSDAVQEITTRMQEYFISDILANSQGLSTAQFSPRGESLFDDLKEKNYRAIVQFSKWDYQVTKQPEAARELIDSIAKSLISTGVIRDKFYDPAVREKISPEGREHLSVRQTPEEEYMQHRREIGVRTFKNSCRTLDTEYTNLHPQTVHKYKLFRDVYCYTQKEGENFAVKYNNVYAAIPTTVRKNVEQALSPNPKMKSFLKEFQLDQIEELRARAVGKYSTIEEATEHQEELIADMIEEERQGMEQKMACQLAIDYISGMTDRAFNDLAIKTGYMEYRDIFESERGTVSESVQDILAKNQKEKEEEERLKREQQQNDGTDR